MKSQKNWISLFMVSAMILAFVSGCAPATNESTVNATGSESPVSTQLPTETQVGDKVDTSEFVELIVYQFGEPQLDMPLVVDELNKKLKNDINASLKFNYIPWTDYQTKYSLLLASGEPIDLVYTATWTPFIEHAQKGAFMPLEDLLPVYAPQSYARFNEMDWLEASYNGHIYALPSYDIKILPDGVMYRDDLRKKYGLEPISSMETLEAYLQAVKDNEPDIIPYHASTTLDSEGTMALFTQEYGYDYMPPPLKELMVYKADANQEHMREVQVIALMPEFEEFALKMRDWYERGFWSRSVSSNKVTSMESMVNGTSAISICHIDRCKGEIGDKILADNPEWEPKAWFPNDNSGILFRAATLQDATALPRSCRYPERALMALELLINDREYYDLAMYGIEGKHYILTEDGGIIPPEGMSAQENPFNPGGLNTWNLTNQDFVRDSAAPNQWMDFYSARERMTEYSLKNKFNAFQLDMDPIRSEMAAITQLHQQYMLPLLYGAVDPVTGLEEYREQLRRAGIEKVLEEVKRQVAAFADKYGY